MDCPDTANQIANPDTEKRASTAPSLPLIVGSFALACVWVAVCSVVALGCALIAIETEWGGRPPEDFTANLATYESLYFWFFSMLIYAVASVATGVGALVSWLRKHQSRWWLLSLFLLNLIFTALARAIVVSLASQLA
jgi:hypothetical protein